MIMLDFALFSCINWNKWTMSGFFPKRWPWKKKMKISRSFISNSVKHTDHPLSSSSASSSTSSCGPSVMADDSLDLKLLSRASVYRKDQTSLKHTLTTTEFTVYFNFSNLAQHIVPSCLFFSAWAFFQFSVLEPFIFLSSLQVLSHSVTGWLFLHFRESKETK